MYRWYETQVFKYFAWNIGIIECGGGHIRSKVNQKKRVLKWGWLAEKYFNSVFASLCTIKMQGELKKWIKEAGGVVALDLEKGKLIREKQNIQSRQKNITSEIYRISLLL